jgi:Tfp pilus assembly protein PilX
MTPAKKVRITRGKRRASALIVALMFVLIFSALALSMMTISGTNVQLASNHHNIDGALSSAQSGQEVVRYWLSQVLFPSSTKQADYFSAVIAALKTDLTSAKITNVVVQDDGSIGTVMLDSTAGLTFDAQLKMIDVNTVQARVTGHSGGIARTIRTQYNIQPYVFPIFNYGLATKGPINFPGNPTITAVNAAWEADVFVESLNNSIAMLSIGNVNFDGDIKIGNPAGTVDFESAVQIAGDYGQTAIDNHVSSGNDSPQFPVPDVNLFTAYATGPVVDSSWDLSKGITLTNATIKAGTNPDFQGTVTVNGVLFIQSPNKVTFGSNMQLNGILVANGDVINPDPSSRRIDILGNFASGPYPSDPQFDAIRNQIGTSIIAPGFFVTFGGNFSTLEGVVAASGLYFSGNVNAQVKGSLINYSNSPTVIEGNAVMNFDRANSTKIPAGFDLYRELDYVPASYAESAL